MKTDSINLRWSSDDYATLNLSKIRCGTNYALYLNIVPNECLDFHEITDEKLDILWSGSFDTIVIPQELRLMKVLTFRSEFANRIRARRHQAIQAASVHGKRIITAPLKCYKCSVNHQIQEIMNRKLTDALDFSQMTLF